MRREELARLLRGSAIYAVGNVANRLVSLLMLPFLTAFLTPGEFGALSLLTVFSLFLVPLFSLGLGSSIGVCYFNAGSADRRGAVIWTAAWLSLGAGVILAGAGLAWAEAVSRMVTGLPHFAAAAALAVVAAALGVIGLPWQLKLQFEERPLAFVLASLANAAVNGALTVWLVAAAGAGIVGPLLGAAAG